MKHESIRLYEAAVQRAREGYLKYDHLVREVSVVGNLHWRATNKHGEMVAVAPTQSLCERLLYLKVSYGSVIPNVNEFVPLWSAIQDIGWGYEFSSTWPPEPPTPPCHQLHKSTKDLQLWLDDDGWIIAVGDSGGSSWAVTMYKAEGL